MLEEKEIQTLPNNTESVQNTESVLVTPESTAMSVIAEENTAIMQAIADSTDTETLKANIELFNNNSIKQAVIQEDINTKIKMAAAEQIYKNITEHPDYHTTKEYADIYKAISDISDKNKTQINRINEQPLIQINTQKNNITVNNIGQDLTRDQRENIQNVITQILKMSGKVTEEVVENTVYENPPDNVIDAAIEEK